MFIKKKKKFIKITNNNLDKVKAPEKWPKSKRPLQAKFLRKKQTGVGENSDPRMGPVFDGRLDTGLARTPRPIGAVRLYFFFFFFKCILTYLQKVGTVNFVTPFRKIEVLHA